MQPETHNSQELEHGHGTAWRDTSESHELASDHTLAVAPPREESTEELAARREDDAVRGDEHSVIQLNRHIGEIARIEQEVSGAVALTIGTIRKAGPRQGQLEFSYNDSQSRREGAA